MVQEEKISEKRINERKEKIKTWLKSPDNLLLLALVLFALGIRLYYFSLTTNQPLWWDEGEYGLKAKAFALGTSENGWFGAREIVVPFLFSIILRLGGGEVGLRILQLVISCLTVLLVYLLGSAMFNKRTAIIATIIMSVNAVHLFFTCRILTYLWAPFFFLLTFYLFYQGYINQKGKKYIYATPVIAAIGLSTYGSLAFGLGAILLFLVITERLNFLKKKELWQMALMGFITLIPQFIYSKITYGSFFARFAGLYSAGTNPVDWSYWFSYLAFMPHLFGTVFTILMAAGLTYILFSLAISYDLVLKNISLKLKSYLLILLWTLAVLGFYTYVAIQWQVVYDGFVLSFMPSLALIGAIGLEVLYGFKFDKRIVTIVVLGILAVGAYNQVIYADGMIKNKLTSFDGIKYAGEWIKQHSSSKDIIISASLPQMTYYSERETYPYIRVQATPDDPINRSTEADFDNFIKIKKPRYMTDSLFENVPAWVHNYAQKHNDMLVPVQVYYLDAQKTQISTIVYEVKY